MTLGETLRAAREDAGMSVEDVSRATRIRGQLVRDIESDQFEACGGAVYARGHIRAIATSLHLDATALIAEFDRREGWADGSTPSCAHWLGWKCGIDSGAAREKVRIARALEALPMISAAMARGAISYSKVRALSRVATAETEDTLLMIALHGTAHR